ncbi:hypothetical protein SNE40_015447 [Patella caerulea]|uniref:LisH domain-containing protein ARMC9 n=1 Tax=Patella caerulea TaxID=87958 RepID=A0AAN8JNI6_PATCE
MSGNLSVVAFEGELNGIVKEYLAFNSFEKTIGSFEDECSEKGKPIAISESRSQSNTKTLDIQNELLKAYRDGQRDEYFRLWNEHLPQEIRNEDSVAQKLEFYINIFFAIYPIKAEKTQAEVDQSMGEFKQYLENRGATLSQTTEFLPFYALPFVPNPKAHPSYKELFLDSWSQDMEVRLDKFLTLALKSTPQPRLFDLYRGGGTTDIKVAEQHINLLQQQLTDADKKTATYMKRHSKVQADYHNLIGITADLVDALESTVQGKPITPEYLSQLCTRLFAGHMRNSIDLTRPGTAGEALRASVAPTRASKPVEVEQFPTLDYRKVRNDLMTGTPRNQALLLQALRWRLTKSHIEKRDAIINQYINNDILGCASPGPYRDSMKKLLTSKSEDVKQGTARLYNAFASLCVGRTYLSSNPELTPALLANLHSEDKDSITREMILGALQKLSLRRALQTAMIEKGVIEWLVGVLEDNDNLSDYTLEYSVALLMNLCLRTSGKIRCSKNSHQTLKVLSDLLGHENTEIRPYVNGALYSILAISSIREEAKRMDMEAILKCFIKDDQPDMNRQIEFIIKQLNSNEAAEEEDGDEDGEDEDGEEDQDTLEADLDKDETLTPQPGELSGETLLNAVYLTNADKNKKKILEQNQLLQRPVTPGQRKITESRLGNVRSSSQADGRISSQSMVGGGTQAGQGDALLARPPTRSGSRTNEKESNAKDTETANKEALERSMRPSTKAMEKLGPKANVKEYASAFGAKPLIPRTPDSSGKRPISRGSIPRATPQPQYSQSGPRPSSAGKSGTTSPRKTNNSQQRSQPDGKY